MHRNKLLRLLSRYEASHPAEDLVRFRAFVERQPRCFERDCWDDGHITASAAVLDPGGSAMLLTLHAKLGKWLQLGGHADGDADPLAVACREAREESGLVVRPLTTDAIDCDIHAIPAQGDEPAHFHYDVRFLVVAEPTPLTITPESIALKWVPLAKIESVTSEASLLRMASKCQALRHPPFVL